MSKHYSFLDEFGNFGYDFDKEGVSSHFIITAIIVEESKLNELEEKLEIIREKNFQSGELKSSKVGNNHKRRKRILSELNLLPFHIYSFVIDKRKLYSNGLRNKSSFYKFLNGLVEHKLFIAFPNLSMIADQIGKKEFMSSFVSYVRRNHIPDLFDNSEFGFVDSKSNVCVQLADFISGTISRKFDKTVYSEEGQSFLNIIRTHIIDIVEWPFQSNRFVFEHNSEMTLSENDKIISEQSVILARSFVRKYGKSPEQERIYQISTLKFLLFYFRWINSFRYVSTRELYYNMVGTNKGKLSLQYFRSKVIARLRDEGVLIASSHRGYKLPARVSDIYEFINHSNQIIKPLLDRMEKCRKHIKLATKNNLDVFEIEEYKYLKKLYS